MLRFCVLEKIIFDFRRIDLCFSAAVCPVWLLYLPHCILSHLIETKVNKFLVLLDSLLDVDSLSKCLYTGQFDVDVHLHTELGISKFYIER